MNYEMIEKQVKDFVLKELEDAKKHPEYRMNCRAIAFGAIQFASNNLFPSYNRDLEDWWSNEIWAQF